MFNNLDLNEANVQHCGQKQGAQKPYRVDDIHRPPPLIVTGLVSTYQTHQPQASLVMQNTFESAVPAVTIAGDCAGDPWSAACMSQLNASVDQLQLMAMQTQDDIDAHDYSPTTYQAYNVPRVSPTGYHENTDVFSKMRAERRKVQNRAAQRAYRDRKEKALAELRELLDEKEILYQRLQSDHRELQHKYDKILAAQRENGLSPILPTDVLELLNLPFTTPSEVTSSLASPVT